MSSFYKLLFCCAFLCAALPLQASALAELDFTSDSDRFALDQLEVDFGNTLRVSFDSSATDSVQDFRVVLTDLVLTGGVTELVPGVWAANVDNAIDYTLRIVNPAGQEVLRASYDPGEFLLIGTSGTLSPVRGSDLTDVVLLNGGESFPTLAELLAADQDDQLAIDFSVTLASAGGTNLVTALQDDIRIEGAVSGSLAVWVVPEPATLSLLIPGLAGLAFYSRRLRR